MEIRTPWTQTPDFRVVAVDQRDKPLHFMPGIGQLFHQRPHAMTGRTPRVSRDGRYHCDSHFTTQSGDDEPTTVN
jgi:hypothetical protein